MTALLTLVRERVRVTGLVQGVGFRPFVHRLATDLGLTGWVANDGAGVLLEVEGSVESLAQFHHRLRAEQPRLADISAVLRTTCEPLLEHGFRIADSSATGRGALVPPDVAACDACLAEIADPTNRRFRYPFGNCTDCGPRFTVITGTPYDRQRTTMSGFALCTACETERSDPLDRRFHAEPTACPECGPTLALGDLRGEAALQEAHRLLTAGALVAVKGLGGFHLVCDATSASAVAELRRRKHRPDKPFAVLVADLAGARRLAEVNEAEAVLLSTPARPIVLLRSRGGLPGVAEGLDEIGVQLPSTPLHVLLLEGHDVLVLTSGNLTEEPICFTDGERLHHLVDAVLTHDRPIHLPCDDSVARVVDGMTVLLRRSRGYAPLPLPLPRDTRAVLAVGGDLKAAVCLAAGRRAWLGPHVGDLGSLEGSEALERSAEHLVQLLRQSPEVVACDAHPGYASVGLAERLAVHWGVPLVRVQHHHAHVVAALAESGVAESAVGVAFDGTGFGCDGTIWGGEVLHVDGAVCTRLGHLRAIELPGGDTAVRRPSRSALAHLFAAGVPWGADLAPVASCDEIELGVVRTQLERGVGTTSTSSVGRLFDAVAALCGVRQTVSYEAQAALELEARSRHPVPDRYPFLLEDGVFDAAPVIRAIVEDLRHGASAATVGARFTASLADVVVEVAADAADAARTRVVALSGGVFAHVDLLRRTRAGLADRGLRVVVPQLVPCGDGGLSLGQAVIAGSSSLKEEPCA